MKRRSLAILLLLLMTPPRRRHSLVESASTAKSSNSQRDSTSSLFTSAARRRAAIASSFLPQKYTLPEEQTTSSNKQQPQQLPPPTNRRRPTLLIPSNPLYLWSSLFAGAGSGVLASIVCAPLDVLRTRLQVWGDVDVQHRHSKALTVIRQIYQYEGWTGYFRGLGATLITVPLFWSLYFPTYDYLKAHYTTQYPTTPTYLIHCGSAIVAGGLADVVCNPLFVVRTRLQTDALHHARGTLNAGIVATVKDLYQTGGFRIFWRGMTASLFGLSHVAVQFPIYEFLKSEARKKNKQEESPVDLLLASGLSKMCASLLTYPHEVVRSRMMDYRSEVGTAASQGAKLWPTIHRIYQHEGVSGFYSGLHISLLRVIPNCCITFLTYELLLRWSREQLERRQRRP